MPSQEQIAEQVFFKARIEKALQEQMNTFRGYATVVEPSYQFYRHCVAIGNVLDRIADGELKRVMFFIPPRHGKSESISRLFPGYYLFKNPRHQMGLASYGAELAESLSRDARENYRRTGRRVLEDASALSEWHTEFGGRFWCAGVGGSSTGKGFHCGIVDDPVKDAEEAYSQTVRDSTWQWWNYVWYTRREPNAALILVQTRWHPDDLAGRILEQEEVSPQRWHIVNLSAIKEGPQGFPETCTIEEDWREEGQALCPERYSEEELLRTKADIGQTAWLSLFQQRPTDDRGAIWHREWFKTFNPDDVREMEFENRGKDWDTAYTEKEENSATAYVDAAVGQDGRIYIFGLNYDWLEFPEAIEWIKELGGPDYLEAKASGKSIVQVLRSRNALLRLLSEPRNIEWFRMAGPIANTLPPIQVVWPSQRSQEGTLVGCVFLEAE